MGFNSVVSTCPVSLQPSLLGLRIQRLPHHLLRIPGNLSVRVADGGICSCGDARPLGRGWLPWQERGLQTCSRTRWASCLPETMRVCGNLGSVRCELLLNLGTQPPLAANSSNISVGSGAECGESAPAPPLQNPPCLGTWGCPPLVQNTWCTLPRGRGEERPAREGWRQGSLEGVQVARAGMQGRIHELLLESHGVRMRVCSPAEGQDSEMPLSRL